MLEPTPLDERKQQILKAVVSDYTVTGMPVGSQVLAAKYFIELSSATIRNELADLVGTGYLQQPHTPAGARPAPPGGPDPDRPRLPLFRRLPDGGGGGLAHHPPGGEAGV